MVRKRSVLSNICNRACDPCQEMKHQTVQVQVEFDIVGNKESRSLFSWDQFAMAIKPPTLNSEHSPIHEIFIRIISSKVAEPKFMHEIT